MINMFEKKKYIQKESLRKMVKSNKVSSVKISSGSQVQEYRIWKDAYYLALIPEVWIYIEYTNGDVESVSAKSLKNTYRVNSVYINGERFY